MGVGAAACSCIARAGFTPVDSCRSCLPCKRPRPVSSSPSPSSLLSSFPRQVKQPASPSATKPAHRSCVRVVSCLVATCRRFQSPGPPYTSRSRSQILCALAFDCLTVRNRPNKTCPHLFRLPLETAPLTDHRDTSIFPPVRHRALRVRTKLSVPSHPRPGPGTDRDTRSQGNLLLQGFVVSFETPARLDGKLTQETMISS